MDNFPRPLPRPPYRAVAFVEALDYEEDKTPEAAACPREAEAMGMDFEEENGDETETFQPSAPKSSYADYVSETGGDLPSSPVIEMMSVEDQLRQLIVESHSLQIQTALFRNEVEILHCRAFVVTVENDMVRFDIRAWVV
jgi:hypothetical protein